VNVYESVGKRTLDIALSACALVVLAPFMAVIGLAVVLDDGIPILFRQRRVGRNGQPITILKFRSMSVGTGDIPSASVGTTVRITRVGRVIRRLSLDELPQLFCVLWGDMSIVGPRPALPSQVELLRLRTENGAMACRPGLTGLAQVNSYDGMPDTEKANWDKAYSESISLFTDLSIILRTFSYVMKPPPTY